MGILTIVWFTLSILELFKYCRIANCGEPEFLLPTANESVPNVNIEGYDDLPKEGRTITFSCPPGFILIGPNSATCTENEEWEPDFAGLMCNNSGKYYVSVVFHCVV